MDNITILHIPVNSRLSPDKTPVGAVREPPTTRPFQRLRDATITGDINTDRGRMLRKKNHILAYPAYPCEFPSFTHVRAIHIGRVVGGSRTAPTGD